MSKTYEQHLLNRLPPGSRLVQRIQDELVFEVPPGKEADAIAALLASNPTRRPGTPPSLRPPPSEEAVP